MVVQVVQMSSRVATGVMMRMQVLVMGGESMMLLGVMVEQEALVTVVGQRWRPAGLGQIGGQEMFGGGQRRRGGRRGSSDGGRGGCMRR